MQSTIGDIMNNNFNIFSEGMKDFMNPENFTKNLKGMPGVDFANLSDNLKCNSEALTQAGQMAAESAQAIIRRGAEIVQDNASHAFNSLKEIASAGNPENAVNRQQQFVQNFVQQAVANTKEMMDMSSKAMMEVFEKVSNHAHSNVSTAMASVNKATNNMKKA